MTRRVKDLYDYTCQFCGVQLTLPGGTAYAEGAHIRPLGTPHDGDDVESNILCLCPNDHLLFDRGALVLTDELKIVTTETGDASRIVRTAEGHTIDLASVRYHRSIFGRRAP